MTETIITYIIYGGLGLLAIAIVISMFVYILLRLPVVMVKLPIVLIKKLSILGVFILCFVFYYYEQPFLIVLMFVILLVLEKLGRIEK